jgi:hypothetical protein
MLKVLRGPFILAALLVPPCLPALMEPHRRSVPPVSTERRCGSVDAKPGPPLRLEAAIVGDPARPFGIAARASSPLDADIELEALLPDGVAALGGDRKRRARTPDLRLDCVARDGARREILVRATLEAGGARMTRVASLVLHDAPSSPPGILKKNSRGEAILEFDR